MSSMPPAWTERKDLATYNRFTSFTNAGGHNCKIIATSPPTSLSQGAYKREMFGGFTAGVVGTVIGYPLDTIKTRMQTGNAGGGGILSVAKR